MSLLEVCNASYDYGPKKVFADIGFQINKGEIFCIVGPNGCGKTTLLDCVGGLHKLKQGTVLLNGQNMTRLKPPDVARQIAYVPQGHTKTFPYTVLDIVLMGRTARIDLFSSPSDEDVDSAEQALELVGLAAFKDRPYTQLSGGESQLVMIARALAQEAPVMVMDEPTAHLDFKHELEVLETVVQLVKEQGLAVIMATHFPNHAFYFENNRLPTAVALMADAAFLAVGAPNDVLNEENLRTLYKIDTRVLTHQIADFGEIRQVIALRTLGNKNRE